MAKTSMKNKPRLDKFKRKLNQFIQQIRNRLLVFHKRMLFCYLLFKFRIRQYLRFVWFSFFFKYSHLILTLAYCVAVGAISYFFARNTTELFAQHAFTFLITIGAALIGVLAIVLTFSNILMQNAAQQSSAGFYSTLAKNRWLPVIYWVIALSAFAYFALALFMSGSHPSYIQAVAGISLVGLGANLYLIYMLNLIIFERIKPASNLKIIKKESLDLIESIGRAANESAQILYNNPDKDEEATMESALAATFQQMGPYFDYLGVRLDHLFDYHDKLYALHENRMARDTLTVAAEVLMKYFELRKNSSFITLSRDFLLVGLSDSQTFLTQNLEQFVFKGSLYIKANDNKGITHLIMILRQLTLSASQIKYLSQLRMENPIFTQCKGHLDQVISIAIKENHAEALFQAAGAMGQIGVVAIDSDLHSDFLGVLRSLKKISLYALKQSDDVVLSRVIENYDLLLNKLVLSQKYGVGTSDSLFDEIREVTLHAYVLSITTSGVHSLAQDKLIMLFEHLKVCVFDAARAANKSRRKDDKEKLIRLTKHLAKETQRLLRELSEKLKTADHIFIHTFSDTIRKIGCLLLDLAEKNDWKEHKESLVKEAGWYLHLPSWFIYHAKDIEANLMFDELVESVAFIGERAITLGHHQLGNESLDILSRMALSLMQKQAGNHYGGDEVRIMEKAVYLGVLATKFNHPNYVEKFQKAITEFHIAYEKKWFANMPSGVEPTSPRRDPITWMLAGLSARYQRHEYDRIAILESIQDKVFSQVSEHDVAIFLEQMNVQAITLSHDTHPNEDLV